MPLRFIGEDPNTDGGHSPTVWIDEEKREAVLQGWEADEATLIECRKTGGIPKHEKVVRVPARMTGMLREACDVIEGLDLR